MAMSMVVLEKKMWSTVTYLSICMIGVSGDVEVNQDVKRRVRREMVIDIVCGRLYG